MKSEIIKKYKDVSPEQTVENVKNFFKKKGFIIEEEFLKNPTQYAWWCRVNLKFNNVDILGTNGKGTTKEFALASGYGELYERYCNFIHQPYVKRINQKKIQEISKKENGYYLFPDETFIPVDQILDEFPCINNYCKALDDNNNSFLRYYEKEYPNGVLSVPFKGFNMSDTINLPFELLLEATGSSGCAAGNTIEEALTQGLSEICEHYVSDLIFLETRSLPTLNIKKINCSDYIKTFFQTLENKGYSYTIFDFSYLFNLPVIGLFIIDKNTHLSFLNLGAFPVFDIALERCCTETFQGFSEVLGDNIKKYMRPIGQTDPNAILFWNKSCITMSDTYPDIFILNTHEVEDYNKNIFLENNKYSNFDFNTYYRNIFNMKHWEVYYRDFSQDENIKAIKAYVKNVEIKNNSDIHLINLVPTLIKKRKWNIVFKWNQVIEEYFMNQTINEKLLLEVIELQKIKHKPEYNIIPMHRYVYDFFDLIGFNKICNEMDFDKLYHSLTEPNGYGKFLYENYRFPMQYDLIPYYSFLFLYSKANYSNDDIRKIASAHGVYYTEEDFKNKDNVIYYLEKLYFSPYYNYYNSKEHEQLMKIFILGNNK